MCAEPDGRFEAGVSKKSRRMVQRRGRARFPEASIGRLAIGVVRAGQKLESHPAAERKIPAQVDHAHSATAQLFQHAVV